MLLRGSGRSRLLVAVAVLIVTVTVLVPSPDAVSCHSTISVNVILGDLDRVLDIVIIAVRSTCCPVRGLID